MHVSNFGGVAGSEDFACATLLTTPFDFQGKLKIFCHPTLLKIRFKISVTPLPPLKRAKSKLRCFNKLQWSVDFEWTFKPQVLVTHDNLFHQGEPF